ncbi:MAG: Hsp20/alpha crystallin family protein [Patescibacteria group bacterium]|nr:MAG: Hsp20/alpha crystallin family protein [Patescibacteria group bacterium]
MSLLPKNQNPLEDLDRGLMDLSKGFIPAVDVYENAGDVVVETALAGVDPKDVEVTVEGGVLTLRGKTEHRKEVDEKDYLYKEVRYGAFQRKIALPAPVIGEKAEATSEHGLLRITIPKAEEGKKKEIKIEVKGK